MRNEVVLLISIIIVICQVKSYESSSVSELLLPIYKVRYRGGSSNVDKKKRSLTKKLKSFTEILEENGGELPKDIDELNDLRKQLRAADKEISAIIKAKHQKRRRGKTRGFI